MSVCRTREIWILDKHPETEKLIDEAKKGSQRAFSELVIRYTPLIESECLCRAGTMDMDDLKQAALIGLYSAVCAYDAERGVTFGAYARVCIGHRLNSELRRAPRASEPLDEKSLAADASASSPEDELIARESFRKSVADIDAALSDYERRVFRLYLGGESYKFIAARLGKSEKSVDSAICRSKEKLRRILGGTNKSK